MRHPTILATLAAVIAAGPSTAQDQFDDLQPPGFHWTEWDCLSLKFKNVELCTTNNQTGTPHNWAFVTCENSAAWCTGNALPCLGPAEDVNGNPRLKPNGTPWTDWPYFNKGEKGPDYGKAWAVTGNEPALDEFRWRAAKCFRVQPCKCDPNQTWHKGAWRHKCLLNRQEPPRLTSAPNAKIYEAGAGCVADAGGGANGPPPGFSQN